MAKKIHVLVVSAVDEQLQRIEPALFEALHVAPGPPVRGQLERLHVGAELHCDIGRVEQTVAALDAVGEGIDGGAGNLIDRRPGILQRDGRLEHEQVVVAGVVVVDDPSPGHRGPP